MLLAQPPDRRPLRLAFGDRGVQDQPVGQRLFQHLLQHRTQPGIRARRGQFDQHVIRARPALAAAGGAGDVLQHERHANRRHDLESLDRTGIMRLETGEQVERGLRRGDGAQRHGGFTRPWRQLEHRGGDDAKRALRADEELTQAIAGVVLAQPAQPVPDRAVGQHHLQPEHQVARVAVAHRVVATGVGGQHAADLRAALRRDRQRQQAAGISRCDLRRLQRDAGLDGHGQIDRVDRTHTVQPRQAEHELAAIGIRRRARRPSRCCRPAAPARRRRRRTAAPRRQAPRCSAGRTTAGVRPRYSRRQSSQ